MFVTYLDRDVSVKRANHEHTIESVARMDVWMLVMVMLSCDLQNVDLDDKQKWMQMKY